MCVRVCVCVCVCVWCACVRACLPACLPAYLLRVAQLEKMKFSKTLKLASIGLNPPNALLEWNAVGRASLQRALDRVHPYICIDP